MNINFGVILFNPIQRAFQARMPETQSTLRIIGGSLRLQSKMQKKYGESWIGKGG